MFEFLDCNRAKGSDFAYFDRETAVVALLFNPGVMCGVSISDWPVR